MRELYAHGATPAQPGEFTLRAFLAGKIDLAQAEAVLGVIDSTADEELTAALRQLAGGLSGKIIGVRNNLADLLADLEAGLDFVEEDIEFVSNNALIARLRTAADSISDLERQTSERIQSTIRPRVVLAGLPNAGKSTLFNELLQRSEAIVSETAGATRDYLASVVRWGELEVELIDTAGWAASENGIEGFARQLRDEQLSRADCVVWCRSCRLDAAAAELDSQLQLQLESRTLMIPVLTKCDLALTRQDAGVNVENFDFEVSAKTAEGLESLRQEIERVLSNEKSSVSDFVGSTAARSRSSLAHAGSSIENAIEAAANSLGDEFVAVELRDALDSLGLIVGAVYTDDLLDRIFSRFCIGK